jgi:hypothetical protein
MQNKLLDIELAKRCKHHMEVIMESYYIDIKGNLMMTCILYFKTKIYIFIIEF